MNQIEKNAYVRLCALTLVLLALFYVGYLYLPEKIKAVSLEIIEKKQEVRNLDMQINKLDDIKEEYEQIKKSSSGIKKNIVNYSDIYEFSSGVKEIAERSGVEYESNVLDNKNNLLAEDLLYLDYGMNVTGSFEQTMNFLGSLEFLEYYNNIESLTISSKPKEGKDKSSEVSLAFLLRVYVWEDREE